MTVCPRARYPSGRSLADELEHWLADAPVAAAPDTITDRVSRFARKHRSYVQAGALAVVLTAAVSIAAALAVNEQRRQKSRLADEPTRSTPHFPSRGVGDLLMTGTTRIRPSPGPPRNPQYPDFPGRIIPTPSGYPK